MIDKRKLRGPLRVPIDESKDIQPQLVERFRAVYEFFKVNINAADADAALVCALAEEVFPDAFRRVTQKPADPRTKIADPHTLREVVSALVAGDIEMLEPGVKKIASEAKKRIPSDRRRPSRKAIIEALAKTKGTPWYGDNPHTLRDYLYREEHERVRRTEQLKTALKNLRDEIFKKYPSDPQDVDD